MRRVAATLAVALAAAAALCAIWARTAPEPPSPAGRGAPDTPAAAALPAVETRPPPPAEPREADERSRRPQPELLPWLDETGEPSLALLRVALAETIAEKLPRYKLSSDELDRLAEAAFRLRKAQQALKALPASDAHAEERRALVEQIQAAGADFAYGLEMMPGEFTARVQTDVAPDPPQSAERPR